MGKFYITTAIPYLNAPAHLGHALEYIQADVLARYHRQQGDDVWFLTGSDEHGNKIAHAAETAGKDPQTFVDEMVKGYQVLLRQLNISNDDFIRTTDQKRHWPAVVKVWEQLSANGDLYKKEYEGLYCVGHEAFIKKSELVDGQCPIHKSTPESIKEENWFFKLTKYKNQIRKAIEKDELKIIPVTRKNEILNLFDDAEDVSFSRPREVLQWGIPVPGDSGQTLYVWADALTNYISALGGPNSEEFKRFWPADVHLIGKDILRFHAMIWPAILLATDLELPQAIYVHGFITVDGQKMSKTVGNVIDPFQVIEKYNSETLRYFLLREIPSGDDGDFSFKNLESRYNSDLANGLGNLVQRIATLIETRLAGQLGDGDDSNKELVRPLAEVFDDKNYHEAIEQFRLHDALANIWEKIALTNRYANDTEPWHMTDGAGLNTVLKNLAKAIGHIGQLLEPFLPETSTKIDQIFTEKGIKKPREALFPRR